MIYLGMPTLPLLFLTPFPQHFSRVAVLFYVNEGEGESLTKALRSGAGTVPLGSPRGERSEDRERIFLAGKNSRLSQGLSRAFAVERRSLL